LAVCLLVRRGALPRCTGDDGDAVVRIGYTGPLSGGAALDGRNALDGIRMALNEIRAEGGARWTYACFRSRPIWERLTEHDLIGDPEQSSVGLGG